MTAAATTGPASGPRPASSQPAIGQTPRLISARSRRKLGGATAITPFGRSAFSLPACLPDFPSVFLADLSRIMAGIRAPARRRAQPGTRRNSRYSVLSVGSIRQMNPPVVADFNARRDHDFPRMIVGIAKVAGVAAVVGL